MVRGVLCTSTVQVVCMIDIYIYIDIYILVVVRGVYTAIYTRHESVCVWAWHGMRGAVCEKGVISFSVY